MKKVALIGGLALLTGGLGILWWKTRAKKAAGTEVTWASGLGDVDQDGWVTDADIALVKEIILGRISPTDEQFRRADVNQDGHVTATDISYIKAILDGRFVPE